MEYTQKKSKPWKTLFQQPNEYLIENCSSDSHHLVQFNLYPMGLTLSTTAGPLTAMVLYSTTRKHGSNFFCLLLTCVIPAYRTWKILQNPDTEITKAQLRSLAQYWTVAAFLEATDPFLNTFLSHFPFYYELKVAFRTWLLLSGKGTNVLYTKVLTPTLGKREVDIDNLVDESLTYTNRVIDQTGTYLTDSIRNAHPNAPQMAISMIDNGKSFAHSLLGFRPDSPFKYPQRSTSSNV